MRRFALLCAGALVALSVTLVPSTAVEAADDSLPKGLRYPSLSGDGSHVVFSYRGDIWVAETKAKDPRVTRLTIHEAQDTLPRFSPDGKMIAFISTRAGGYDIYTVPVEGGEPKRLTFHSGVEIMCDFAPDGKSILFLSDRDATKRGLDVYSVPVEGGAARRLTIDANIRDASWRKDMKQIVFVRGTNTIYQDNYRGSANYDIWVQDIPAAGEAPKLPKRLTETDGNERYPFFSDDGKTVYFIAEKGGVANFYAMPSAGGERTQRTELKGADIHRPDMGADYKTVSFEREGQLYVADLTASEVKPRLLKLNVRSDRRHSGVVRRDISTGAQQVHVRSDGQQLVFAVHGDIWTMAANGGRARRITSGPDQDEWPRWSPDGRKVAFQSNRKGNSDIFVMDANGQNVRQVTKHKADDFYFDWSPDGQHLCFCSERSGNRDVWTINVQTGETTQVTKHKAADDDPTWSPDGRSIAFDSGREGNQAIFICDADGKNMRRVTGPGAFFQVPDFSPDGRFLVYESFNPGAGRAGGLYVIATSGGPSMQLSRDGSAACWSPKGDYVYFTAGAQGNEEIFRVPAPTAIESREKIAFNGTVQVDRRNELADLFDEAWNALKRGFYDEKMHGVDWDAMKKKYKAMAVDAEIRDEFQNVIRQMLAELNASHLGIYGGSQPSHSVPGSTPATGYLGADLAEVAEKSGGRKILRIWKGGPADKVGLRAGDVITSLNKRRLKASTDLDKLLAGTAGKGIEVRYKPFTQDGLGDERRASELKPMAAAQVRAMTYQRWSSKNARTVSKGSKGRLGYIHLTAMNPQNLQKFQRQVSQWIQNDRISGMVLDVRGNGGGNIHQQLMQVLMARPFAWVKVRGAPRRVNQPALFWDRPVVVLTDERSFSDAEVFPHIFQSMERGKVVGIATPGGVIGTNDITLSDGTRFRVPRVGYYGMDGTNLEGTGVQPDIVVPMSIEDLREGRDPQLAKAIEVVSAEAKAWRASRRADRTKPKPDDKPATTPTAEPKPENPARVPGVKDTLVDAAVGEWVTYNVNLPGAPEGTKVVLKLTIEDIRDGVVYTSPEIIEGPAVQVPLPMEMENKPLVEALTALGEVSGTRVGTGPLKGEDSESMIATVAMGGADLELFFSNKVPAWGLFRVMMGKMLVLEAIDWGKDEVETDEEAPAKPTPEPGQPEPAANQPTEKPAPAEPAPAKPASESTEKPAAQPAPEEDAAVPGPGAAAAQPAARADQPQIKDPLRDAKAGEWVKMKIRIQGNEGELHQRVESVDDGRATIVNKMEIGDRTIEGQPQQRPLREHMRIRRGGKVDVSRETVTVDGKDLDCIVITRTARNGTVDKRWICDEIPVTGLVRRERAGQVMSELLSWGTSDK